jgi:ankyrin repeat protein
LTLSSLAKGSAALESAYGDALRRIEGQLEGDSKLAKKVLSWITLAKRPLTTSELCCALAVEPNESELDAENIPDVEDIVSVCRGLVIIDLESAIIRLVHYTTQEYFERIQNSWNPDAQLLVASTCITYLSFSVFRYGSCASDEEFERRLQENELFDYVVKYWGEHASMAEDSLCTLACSFLSDSKLVLSATQGLLIPEYKYANYSQEYPKETTGLHLAARFGIATISEAMISIQADDTSIALGKRDSRGQNILHIAVDGGHYEMVKLLLETGTDVNAQVLPPNTSLFGNHEQLMNPFLEHWNRVSAPHMKHVQALQLASARGKNSIVEILLDYGAKIETPCIGFGVVLLAAVIEGHEDTVELLLKRGADASQLDVQRKGLIHHATNQAICKPSLVTLLLDHGAPTDTVDVENMTPLHYCVKFGHKNVAELLRDKGVLINCAVNRKAWNIHRAGEETTYTMCTSNSIQVATCVSGGLTPLHFATLTGNYVMTEFLLENGANPNALSNYGETPLHLSLSTKLRGIKYQDDWNDPGLRAERLWDFLDFEEDDVDSVVDDILKHRVAVLDALLSHPKVDLEERDYKGKCPVHCIDYKKPESTTYMERLVSKGANLSCVDSKQQSALHLASRAGNRNAVSSLLSLGGDVTLPDARGLNALHCAAQSKNYETLVTILADKVAKTANLVASKDGLDMNALHHLLSSSGPHQVETVQLLLDEGVDGFGLDGSGIPPLASYLSSSQLTWSIDICQLLLEIQGNASFIGIDGRTLGHFCAETLGFSAREWDVSRKHGVDLTKRDFEG